jgi:hypothetical protein
MRDVGNFFLTLKDLAEAGISKGLLNVTTVRVHRLVQY